MNHRDRVTQSIYHGKTDRIATGEWAIDKILMSKILNKNLKEFDKYHDTIKVYELLNIDLKGVDCTFESSPVKECLGISKAGRRIIKDGWGEIFEESEFGTLNAGLIESPIKSPADIYLYRFPPISIYERNAEEIEKWVQETDFYIGALVWGGRGMLTSLLGYENYMTWSLTNCSELECLIQEFTQYNSEIAKMYIDAGVQLILLEDDLAGNKGLLMSPNFYRTSLFPHLKAEIEVIKKYARSKGKEIPVFFHSDGNINQVIQDLIDIGIDGLHPLEPAAGMDIASVKLQYGNKITLMGNIDTRFILPMGTPVDVENEVKRVLDAASSEGGLILSSANMFTADVPVKNVFTVYETVKNYITG
ncbi:uroporphyrinogen decarboxylase family protein [Atribacter laminatus]|uniref:Uroporphyrinogen decarboxylase n=1 Tax=Atribacter laminatus TaxID=2847778 RepID=A0A7T1AMU2_ATRLM|nr:uroporphyrinogen decarboxylase family protein [Atribacter laminatus]QPM68812.1 Uroporphyrinogen decarboxylase [Atribacter laminatus]